jgi:hypothetical protein
LLEECKYFLQKVGILEAAIDESMDEWTILVVFLVNLAHLLKTKEGLLSNIKF